MAADSERDTFHVNRVPPEEIGLLLSAQSYRPEVIKAKATVKALGNWSLLENLCSNKIGPGPHPMYVNNGHPCLKTQNVGGIIAENDASGWITPECASQLVQHQVISEDLIMNLTGAGSIGRVSVYFGVDRPITNQHIARMTIKKPNDSCFVAAFLRTWWGERVIEQGISGATGQLNIVNGQLRQIPIPLPDSDAQAYIGNKVRQANKLRNQAQHSEKQFVSVVAFNVPLVVVRAKCSRNQPQASDLNAGKFVPDRLEVRRALIASGGRRLGDFCTINAPNVSSFAPTRLFLGLEGISSSTIDLTFKTAAEAEVTGTARLLNEGAVISKLRPYLNKAAYISSEFAGSIGSTELLNIAAKGVNAGYIYGVLKLETTVRQLNPVATGATHPRIAPEDLLDVIIPWHDDREKLGLALAGAQPRYVSARRLTIAACFLAEALIEQKITEADLIAAHTDPSKDRELLARLTLKGIDVLNEAPLFPNLDALFELITDKENQEIA